MRGFKLALTPLIGMIGMLVAVVAVLVLAVASAVAARGHEFEGSFGEEGEGAGQLKEPAGVAVNEATGDVYVVDKGNKRVEKFAADTGNHRR